MLKKKLLKISEFAKLCHTTRDTLLHYAHKGILRPKYTAANGYRYYDIRQFCHYDIINVLKMSGRSLSDITQSLGQPEKIVALLQESVDSLQKEQERIARRLVALQDLLQIAEEERTTPFDTIFVVQRASERIVLYPVATEKMDTLGGLLQCYSDLFASQIASGSAIELPLGLVMDVQAETARINYIFTRAWKEDHENIHTIPQGEYACLFHKGPLSDHAKFFPTFLAQLKAAGFCQQGPCYLYDHINYFYLFDQGESIVKYMMRVRKQKSNVSD